MKTDLDVKNMWEAMLNSPKENSFAVSYSTNVEILEYTINHPRKAKGFAGMDREGQMQVYENLIKDLGLDEYLGDELHYFEFCKDGTVHMHGRYIMRKARYTREGIVEEFATRILKKIDGRLKYRSGNYYAHLERYRSPSLCIQFTDDFERIMYWDQYMSKNAPK